MAIQVTDGNVITGLVAAADYSANGQHHFVALTESGTVTLATDGALAVGVLMNNPAAGEACQIQIGGVARVEIGATVDVSTNALVGCNATGECITAAAGDHILGIALEDGADGQIASVLLQTGGIVPTP